MNHRLYSLTLTTPEPSTSDLTGAVVGIRWGEKLERCGD
jgi:hypothetical protein